MKTSKRKIAGLLKTDQPQLKLLLRNAKKIDSPYIIYKETVLKTDAILDLLGLLHNFDLVVIPKEAYHDLQD